MSKKSRLLTTFIIPFGRYLFNKLPFGISCAPELFQRRMAKILEGLEGVVCLMDDVLVYGADQAQHDERLLSALRRIEAVGITLNRDKCEFNRDSLSFLGHVIDKHGIRADPKKTAAIVQMQPPENVSSLRRFMGMVNHWASFLHVLLTGAKPLKELMSTK